MVLNSASPKSRIYNSKVFDNESCRTANSRKTNGKQSRKHKKNIRIANTFQLDKSFRKFHSGSTNSYFSGIVIGIMQLDFYAIIFQFLVCMWRKKLMETRCTNGIENLDDLAPSGNNNSMPLCVARLCHECRLPGMHTMPCGKYSRHFMRVYLPIYATADKQRERFTSRDFTHKFRWFNPFCLSCSSRVGKMWY